MWRAASTPSMSGMWMSMSTRSNPARSPDEAFLAGDRLGAVPDAHHAHAGFLQHGPREQRVDVVVLGEQDRMRRVCAARAPPWGRRRNVGRQRRFAVIFAEQLREQRQRPDRPHQVAVKARRAEARDVRPLGWIDDDHRARRAGALIVGEKRPMSRAAPARTRSGR